MIDTRETQAAAPLPAPDDPDAIGKLKLFVRRWIANHIYPDDALRLLLLKNCTPHQTPWPDETIHAVFYEALAEKRAKDRREEKEERARLLANPPDRRSKAAKIKDALNVSLRRAYIILQEKTPDPARAKQLATLFPDTTVDYWYRPKNKTGKRPSYLAWANRVDFAGCRLCDFVQTLDIYEGRPGDLFVALRKRYRAGDAIPKHIEKFADFWLLTAQLADSRTCRALWGEYQAWRIDRIHAACHADLSCTDFS